MARKKAIMEKREDEAMDGDGVVNRKKHEKKKWSSLHVKYI